MVQNRERSALTGLTARERDLRPEELAMRLQELAKKLDNPGLGLDVLRIYTGIALLVRAALFIARPDALTSYMQRTGEWFMPVAIAHYVVLAHAAGGVLLMLGLCTRWAALAQAPILLGAVLFVHLDEGLLSAGQSLELSSLVFVILLVIGTFGPGKLSADYYLEQRTVGDRPSVASTPPHAAPEEEAHAHV